MVLGVDVSTSITGFAVVADGILLYYDSIDLRKYKNVFDKTIAIKEKLLDLYEMYQCNNDEGAMRIGNSQYPIEHIYIEQSLHMFMGGKSSAKTLSTLSRFNGVVSWLCYDILKLKPEYIAATSARKKCGIKVPKGTKAKQVIKKVSEVKKNTKLN